MTDAEQMLFVCGNIWLAVAALAPDNSRWWASMALACIYLGLFIAA